MTSTTNTTDSNDQKQLDEISKISPFTSDELKGQKFGRGNMLGGTVPVTEAAGEAAWRKDS